MSTPPQAGEGAPKAEPSFTGEPLFTSEPSFTAEPLFTGEHIRLTSPRSEDAHTIAHWYEEAEFARLFDSQPAYPRTPNAILRWFDHADRPQTEFTFVIRPLYTNEAIGVMMLDDIRWTHRTAWLALGIGEPAYRGRGYGTDAMRLILRYAFGELNLHRVQLTVFSYNAPAIRLYERIGFVREGVYREALLRGGQRHDLLLYGLLEDEAQAL